MKQLIYLFFVTPCLVSMAKGQTAAADNKGTDILFYRGQRPPGLIETITFDLQPGQALYGVFEGRTPCDGIRQQFKADLSAGCEKVKWRILFFQDSATGAPTTCHVLSVLSRSRLAICRWKILHNSRMGIIYQIDLPELKKAMFLLKGDENVLFLVDDHFSLLKGDADYSYTFNRVRLKGWDGSDGTAAPR